jgi:hypothetical protein
MYTTLHNLCKSTNTHGRTGRKKLGGQKEICPTFSDCARLLPKNFWGTNKFRWPPPPKNFGQCTILGVQKFFSDAQIFSEHQNKPKLPDCESNIARLPLFAQQTGDFFAFLFTTFRPTYQWTFARLFDFLIFLGGQLPPPAPPVPYAYANTNIGRNTYNFIQKPQHHYSYSEVKHSNGLATSSQTAVSISILRNITVFSEKDAVIKHRKYNYVTFEVLWYSMLHQISYACFYEPGYSYFSDKITHLRLSHN